MADRKNQHFVPRALLRPWTKDGANKSISLFNHRSGRGIPAAPVKNQCSRDYFYGRDLKLETWLGRSEGIFAEAVRCLPTKDVAESVASLEIIRDFAYLQSIRTERSLAEEAVLLREMYDQVYHGVLPEEREALPGHEEIVRDAVNRWRQTNHYLADLKGVVVDNQSATPFVISDDPAVHTNRLYTQRFNRGDFGIQQSGMILTMPLSPKLAMLFYDGDVYTIPAKHGLNLSLTKNADAAILNELQYLNSSENVYFSSWSELDEVREGFESVKDRRLTVHFRLNLLIEKEGTTNRFIPAPPDVVAPPGRSIIHLETLSIRPRAWPSFLKVRADASGYSNGSAAGHVRRTWANEASSGTARRERFKK